MTLETLPKHSIIRTHEETGKQALYLGRREWAYIPGLSLSDSEALLDELWSYAALTSNVWQQTWQPNDLIVWDNRRVLHRRDDLDNNTRRLMKRCQVLAVQPMADSATAKLDGRYERTEQTRLRILAAARDLMLSGNLEPTTTDIAKHAGITTRTLFPFCRGRVTASANDSGCRAQCRSHHG